MFRYSNLAVWGALVASACARQSAECPTCGTVVIASVTEPQSLVPPLIWESVGRDIADQIYERLAILTGGSPPMDESAYRPGLAARWERRDSVTWWFGLRNGARWHDGRPVTAADVAFSFAAYQDSLLDAPARPALTGVTTNVVADSLVEIRFPRPYAEQLYDATWHVRIIPRHVWQVVPREAWPADTTTSRLIGSGPYRLTRWDRGQSLTLEQADRSEAGPRRVVWRFAGSPDAAANLVLAHEADVLETIPDPARRPEFERDTTLHLIDYPSAVYGFLGFYVAGAALPLGDDRVRRALARALDRPALAAAIFGPATAVPPGPLSAMLWLWSDPELAPADTLGAAAGLDSAGYGRIADGTRRLVVDILVPATSATRKALAVAIQERWQRLGLKVTVTAVDFPVFQERLARGQFQSFIGAWLDEPSPRSLAEQWGRSGWGAQNYGRYHNPGFDRLLEQTVTATSPREARAAWNQALQVLAYDQPAIFLYTLTNTAVVSRRITGFVPDAYSWIRGLKGWQVSGER